MPSIQDYLKQYEAEAAAAQPKAPGAVDFSQVVMPVAASAKTKDPSLLRRAGDFGVDVLKAVPTLVEAGAGLAGMIPGVHYAADPVGQFAGGVAEGLGNKLYSGKRLEEEAAIQQRMAAVQDSGLMTQAKTAASAYTDNPYALLGMVGQSLGLAKGGAVAGKALLSGLGKPVATGGVVNAGRAATAAQVGEGLVAGGLVAANAAQENPDEFAARYYGLPAGALTTAISRGANKLMPNTADVDVLMAGGMRPTSAGGVAGTLKNVGKMAFKEGVLEEALQSGQEQIFTNASTDQPLLRGVGGAMASGAMAGSVMGGMFGFKQRKPAGTVTNEDLIADVDAGLAPPTAPAEPMADEFAQAQREFEIANQPQGNRYPELAQTSVEELQRMDALLGSKEGKSIEGAKDIRAAIADELQARAKAAEPTLAQINDAKIAQAWGRPEFELEPSPVGDVQRAPELAPEGIAPATDLTATLSLFDEAGRVSPEVMVNERAGRARPVQDMTADEVAARLQEAAAPRAAGGQAELMAGQLPVPNPIVTAQGGGAPVPAASLKGLPIAAKNELSKHLGNPEQLAAAVADMFYTKAGAGSSASYVFDKLPALYQQVTGQPLPETPAAAPAPIAPSAIGAQGAEFLQGETPAQAAANFAQRQELEALAQPLPVLQQPRGKQQSTFLDRQGEVDLVQPGMSRRESAAQRRAREFAERNKAARQQIVAETLGTNIPEVSDAVQEQIPAAVDVRQPAQAGKQVAKGNTQGTPAAEKGQAAQGEVNVPSPVVAKQGRKGAGDNAPASAGVSGTERADTGRAVRGRARAPEAGDSSPVAVGATPAEPAAGVAPEGKVATVTKGYAFKDLRDAYLGSKSGAAGADARMTELTGIAEIEQIGGTKQQREQAKAFLDSTNVDPKEATAARRQAQDAVGRVAAQEKRQTERDKAAAARQKALDKQMKEMLEAEGGEGLFALERKIRNARKKDKSKERNQRGIPAEIAALWDAKMAEMDKLAKRTVAQVVQASQSESKASGTEAAPVNPNAHTMRSLAEALVEHFGEDMRDAILLGRVKLVTNQTHLAAATGDMSRRGKLTQGMYYYNPKAPAGTGTVYFVAANLAKTQQGYTAFDVALHEIGEHAGMEQMLGKQTYAQLMASLRKAMDVQTPKTQFEKDVAAAKKKLLVDQQGQPHEVLAYMIQHTPDSTGLQKMWAAIKAFAARFGLLSDSMKDAATMRALAEGAAARWLKGVAGQVAARGAVGQASGRQDAYTLLDEVAPKFVQWLKTSRAVQEVLDLMREHRTKGMDPTFWNKQLEGTEWKDKQFTYVKGPEDVLKLQLSKTVEAEVLELHEMLRTVVGNQLTEELGPWPDTSAERTAWNAKTPALYKQWSKEMGFDVEHFAYRDNNPESAIEATWDILHAIASLEAQDADASASAALTKVINGLMLGPEPLIGAASGRDTWADVKDALQQVENGRLTLDGEYGFDTMTRLLDEARALQTDYPDSTVVELYKDLGGTGVVYGAGGYNRYGLRADGQLATIESSFASKEKLQQARAALSQAQNVTGAASGIANPEMRQVFTNYGEAVQAAKGVLGKVEKMAPADWKGANLKVFRTMAAWITKHHMVKMFDKWFNGALAKNAEADTIQQAMSARTAQLFNEPHNQFKALPQPMQEKIAQLMELTEMKLDPRKLWDAHTHLHGLTGTALAQAKEYHNKGRQLWGQLGATKQGKAAQGVYNDLAAMNEALYTMELAVSTYNMVHANAGPAKDLPVFKTSPTDKFLQSGALHGSIEAAHTYWKNVLDGYTEQLDKYVAEQRGLLPAKTQTDPEVLAAERKMLKGVQDEKVRRTIRAQLRTRTEALTEDQKKVVRHLSPLEAQLRMASDTVETFKHAPYFHLGRFGDEFVSFRVRADKDGVADPVAMAHVQQVLAKEFPDVAIRSDATDPHVFARFESVDQAAAFKARAEALQKEGWLMQLGVKDKNDKDLGEIRQGTKQEIIAGYHTAGPNWLSRVVESIQAEGFDDAVTKQMVAHVRSLYLDSLPDTAAIKVKQKREGRPGWHKDMMRNYAHRMRVGSNKVASLAAEPTRTQSFADMNDALFKSETDPQMSKMQQNKMHAIVSELQKRDSNQMSVPHTPGVDMLRALNHAYFLGMSPSYLLIQMTQLGVLAWPELAKKHGFVKAAKALGEVSGTAFKVVSTVLREGYARQGLKGAADMVITGDMLERAGLSKDDAAFLVKVMAAGKLDIGNAARNVGRVAEGEAGSEALKIATAMGYASEILTRTVAALAAKRLHKGTEAETLKYAISVVDESMMDYSTSNEGRMMGKQGVAGVASTVMFSFMKYQAQLLEKLYREVHAAAAKKQEGESDKAFEARKTEARKFLGGHLMALMALAGSLGLPFATVVAAVADNLCEVFGDGHCDSKTAMRNMTAEVFGHDIEPLLSKGIISRLAGFDVSERAGEGNVMPFSKFLADKRAMDERLKAMAMDSWGAPTAMIGNALKASEKFGQGDLLGGMQEAVPSALKGPIKAYEMSEKGYVDKAGNVLPMTPGAYDILLQAVGLNPGEKADYQQAKFAQSQRAGVLGREATQIRNKLASAIERNDTDAMQKWLGKAQDYDAENVGSRAILPQMGSVLQQRARARALASATGTPLGLSLRDIEAQKFTSFYRTE